VPESLFEPLFVSLFEPVLTSGLGAGSGLRPPAGFTFLIDDDGAHLKDADGAFLIEPV